MDSYIKPDTKFCDLFTGSGVIAHFYADKCKHVVTCDQEIYSYVLSYALTKCIYTKKMKQIIKDINRSNATYEGLVAKHFAPPKRMFFTAQNAQLIDEIRVFITKEYKKNNICYEEFIFLLASLLCSASKIANTCGTFRAYLKHFSIKSTRPFKLDPVHNKNKLMNKNGTVMCADALSFVLKDHYDVVYMDPPYNNVHYGAYYSFLNYLCLYDHKQELQGTGICCDYNKSTFGMKKHAKQSFFQLFANIRAKDIFMSYSSKAVLSIQEILYIIQSTNRKFVIKHYSMQHKAYRPNKECKDTFVNEFIIHVHNNE